MKGKMVYFLTIVICFLLQCTVMDLISIGSVTPNLMLVFCVSMGLMRGRKSGLWAGFFFRVFCGSVLWIRIWILCFDLYVYWLFKWICAQDLLR